MSQFEFVLIPFAIIVGFAIADLMTSWTVVLKKWEETGDKFLYLSYSIWLVLNLLFGHYGGLWEYRHLEFTNLVAFAVLMPSLLLTLSMMLISFGRELPPDVDVHYYSMSGRSVLFAFGSLIVSTLTDLLPGTGFVTEPGMLIPLSLSGIALLAMYFGESKKVHVGANIVLWFVWLQFIVLGHLFSQG